MYSSIDDFDEVTLNLMTNKVYYNEYLEKNKPIKFKELQEYKKKLDKHSSQILNMTKELFENPDKIFNTETNEIFIEYTKVFIRYLEMKEVEYSNENSSSDIDNDVMFDENNIQNTFTSSVHWSKHQVKKI